MDPLAEIRETFFQECEEQLAALESGLLQMEEGDTSADVVNAVFRAVHSIKGGSGAFKLSNLVAFSHVFETALDKVRSGKLEATQQVMKLLLKASDELADLVALAREGAAEDNGVASAITAELESLMATSGEEPEEEDEFADISFQPISIPLDEGLTDFTGSESSQDSYTITFKPHRSLYQSANEPLALLRCLKQLGEAKTVCDTSLVPLLNEMDPAEAYFSFESKLASNCLHSDVKEIFDFVDTDCDLVISQANATPDIDMKLEELLKVVAEPGPAEELQKPEEIAEKKTTAVSAAKTATQSSSPTIRVELDRVDRLINVVGELVINQAMLAQLFRKTDRGTEPEVSLSLTEMAQLTREIQDSVMAIRAQPLKPLFQRMGRTIREVAEATVKQVRLQTDGESTEVDKTVIELLADPLTHMIRNAVDHGIETPETRLAAGKPEEGVVHLSAAHRSGRVVIQVSDDGAGINRPRVLASAISKGLVTADAQLTESEIDNLLFLPGFSTASSVSNISGRGVGMDVVKKSIQALGGRISIASKPNSGSVFTLSLPLTLAVLDGIVVSVGEQTFVVPLTAIVETLQPEPRDYFSMGAGSLVIKVREKFVPVVDVGVELGVHTSDNMPRAGVAILVETENCNQCALLVDRIQDQRQVVIKGLETNYRHVDGIAAATILGDGRVALILDVEGLITDRTMQPAPYEPLLARAS